MPNMGGPIATAGDLVFVGAAIDSYLRAFDIETGRELWKYKLPAGGQATPMTYRGGADQRQYVVISAGGHGPLGHAARGLRHGVRAAAKAARALTFCERGSMAVYSSSRCCIQAAFIVHVIKTGRNQLWIWVLIIPGLALAGMLAYVVVEILPELFRSRSAQRTARGFRKALDPTRELRRYENEARVAGNVASRQRYAEELVRHERYDDAIAQYRQALSGLYEHDPNLMLGLAQAQFGKGDASAARGTLDELIRLQPRLPLPRRTPAVCARARGRGQHAEGAGGIPARSPALSRARKPRCATRSCCRRRAARRGTEGRARAAAAGAHRARSLPARAARVAGGGRTAGVAPQHQERGEQP